MRRETIVTVDPRTELVNGLQYLTAQDRRLGDILDPDDSEYKSELLASLAGAESHKAVELYEELTHSGLSYDAPHALMQRLSWPGLRLKQELGEELIERVESPEVLERFVASLPEFLAATGFEALITRWRGRFELLCEPLERHCQEAGLLQAVEAFFGIGGPAFSLVVSPLMRGGYCLQIPLSPSADSVIATIGRAFGRAQTLDLGKFSEYVLHEFSHMYVNAVTTRNLEAGEES